MSRTRYSKQQNQEQISRKQFQAFLAQHEWITGDIDPDLGEDIFVRIYRNTLSTGLSLYVQLKSVRNITEHCLLSSDISYDFDTEDINHWEIQTPMVFLVIWDVKQACGWWISIKDAIQYLDGHNSNWRQKKSVAVRIPFKNKVNDNGLEEIQLLLAQLYGPVIGRDKKTDIHLTCRFPKSPEGKEKLEGLQRFINSGDGIELDGRFIAEFIVSEWWTRIYGAPNPKDIVLRLDSSPSNEIIPMDVMFNDDGGNQAHIPYIELKQVKQGFEEFTLSNEHQNKQIQIRMVVSRKDNGVKLTLNTNMVGQSGKNALRNVTINRICAEGGTVTLTNLLNERAIKLRIPPNSLPPVPTLLMKFVKNLALIEDKTGKELKIPEFSSITRGLINEASELASVVETGSYTYTATEFFVNVNKKGLAAMKDGLSSGDTHFFRMEYEAVNYELLSEHFLLGPCVTTVRGTLENSCKEMSEWYEQANEEDSYKIILSSPVLTDEYQYWISKNRL